MNAGHAYAVGNPTYDMGFGHLKKFISEHREQLPLIVWKDTLPQHPVSDTR